MGRDKAPKARQTTNKPSTTLITSSPALSWVRRVLANDGARRVHGGGREPTDAALIAQ